MPTFKCKARKYRPVTADNLPEAFVSADFKQIGEAVEAHGGLSGACRAEDDKVSHRVFGTGTVLRVYHDDATNNDKIDILFDEKGQKTLLLTYAKLEKITS